MLASDDSPIGKRAFQGDDTGVLMAKIMQICKTWGGRVFCYVPRGYAIAISKVQDWRAGEGRASF